MKQKQTTLTQMEFLNAIYNSQYSEEDQEEVEEEIVEETVESTMYSQHTSSINPNDSSQMATTSSAAYETPESSSARNATVTVNIPTYSTSKKQDSNDRFKTTDPYKCSPIRPGTNFSIPLNNDMSVTATRPWVRVELGGEKWIQKERKKCFSWFEHQLVWFLRRFALVNLLNYIC